MKPSPDGRIKLSDAAVDLGCHVETLRLRIRAGLLDATRGPHGAYYVTAAALKEMVPIYRQPPLRRFAAGELDGTWDALDKQAGYSARTQRAEQALIRALRADPSMNPRLYRLASVERLVAGGLTSAEIGLELGITSRHARRLARRSVSVALRKEIYKTTERTKHAAVLEARVVVREIRRRMKRAGFVFHQRSQKARSMHPFPLDTPEDPRQSWLTNRLLQSEKTRLRIVGLSDEQIKAIDIARIGTDELNYLMLNGLPDDEGRAERMSS